MPDGHVVEVVDYRTQWTTEFEAERAAIRVTLASLAIAPIEHIGSTAVPGLCAKPVIDIMVPVASLHTSRPAIPLLEEQHGYHYWPYKADVMHWFCKPSEFARTHHVHLVPHQSALFRQRLAFRNALRADPQLRDRYGELKRELVARFPTDREAYTDAKGPFVQEVLRRVRFGRGPTGRF